MKNDNQGSLSQTSKQQVNAEPSSSDSEENIMVIVESDYSASEDDKKENVAHEITFMRTASVRGAGVGQLNSFPTEDSAPTNQSNSSDLEENDAYNNYSHSSIDDEEIRSNVSFSGESNSEEEVLQSDEEGASTSAIQRMLEKGKRNSVRTAQLCRSEGFGWFTFLMIGVPAVFAVGLSAYSVPFRQVIPFLFAH